MRIELPDIDVTADGEPATASTTMGTIGAAVLAIDTIVDTRIALTSVYVGLDAPIAVTRAVRAGAGPQFEQSVIEGLAGQSLTGQSHARGCVLDHAAHLAALLQRTWNAGAQVQVGDVSLRAAEEVWG